MRPNQKQGKRKNIYISDDVERALLILAAEFGLSQSSTIDKLIFDRYNEISLDPTLKIEELEKKKAELAASKQKEIENIEEQITYLKELSPMFNKTSEARQAQKKMFINNLVRMIKENTPELEIEEIARNQANSLRRGKKPGEPIILAEDLLKEAYNQAEKIIEQLKAKKPITKIEFVIRHCISKEEYAKFGVTEEEVNKWREEHKEQPKDEPSNTM